MSCSQQLSMKANLGAAAALKFASCEHVGKPSAREHSAECSQGSKDASICELVSSSENSRRIAGDNALSHSRPNFSLHDSTLKTLGAEFHGARKFAR